MDWVRIVAACVVLGSFRDFFPNFLTCYYTTAARCYELMLERTLQRQTFGKYLYEHGSCRELIADSASDLEAARLLTLACAVDIDRLGARGARDKIALIKVRSIYHHFGFWASVLSDFLTPLQCSSLLHRRLCPS